MRKPIALALLACMVLLGGGLARAEEGVTDKEIVIGSHQDLSGPIAGWGLQVKLGLEMKAREINDAGGIHGRKIRLIIEDNAYDPKKAILVTQKMIEKDRVFAFVGNMGSPTAGASKPIISAKKIPQMFPLTAASLFFDPYDRYSFGGFVPYYDQARVIVKYFAEKGKTKLGLMYQDDEMGAIMKKGVEDQLTEQKLKLIAAESYKRGATEFSSQIAKLREANVDVVILATVIRETVGALKEANKIGWNVPMVGMTPTYTQTVVDLAKKAGISAEGFLATGQSEYPYEDSTHAPMREWYKRHVQWFGKPPDQPTTAGYTGLHYFALAAQKAGKDLTREKFIDSLEGFDRVPEPTFNGPPITFSKTSHQGAWNSFMFQVKGDKWTRISDALDYRK
jgi:ABC-type branched-subunit amino acid transport system substrate-binding protein